MVGGGGAAISLSINNRWVEDKVKTWQMTSIQEISVTGTELSLRLVWVND